MVLLQAVRSAFEVRLDGCNCCVLLPCPSCSVLKYPDWVYSVAARGGLLLVASGPEVHVHDLPTGKLVRKVSQGAKGSIQVALEFRQMSAVERAVTRHRKWWRMAELVCAAA
jgi:hypothetical protein